MKRMTYGDLDLNLLLVLERLLERQSVTLAAADLGLSQPATSRALQRLRDALGDPLLVRAGRDLVPTDRARALIGPVTDAVEAVGQVFAPPAVFEPATASGPFVLGLGDEAQEAFLRPLYQRLHAEVPGIDLRIRGLGPHSVDEARRGLLDLAIVPDLTALPVEAGRIDIDAFVQRPLYPRHFAVVASREAWPDPPTLEQYVAAEHVIVSFEGGGRGFVDALLARRGLTRRVAASVTSFLAVTRLVAHTALLAILPEEVATDPDLVAHPPPLELPDLPMLLVWHPRSTTQPRHRFLRALVSEVVTEHLRTHHPGPTTDAREAS